MRTRLRQRRTDILLTYVDGVAKSGASYAALYAEENDIMASQVVPPESVVEKYRELISNGDEVNAIVVVDDIVGTGGRSPSYSPNLLVNRGQYSQRLNFEHLPLLPHRRAKRRSIRL